MAITLSTISRLLIFGWLSLSVHQASASRLALIIGNSNYTVAPLSNPENDARAMAKKLRQLGFQVIEKQNLDFDQFHQAVGEFEDRLEQSDIELALFYYAGHAVQLQGSNYLIPTQSNIHTPKQLKHQGINIDQLIASMELSDSQTNILILDACRNNPFIGNSPTGGRAWQAGNGDMKAAGLAPMRAPAETFIAYATGPGKVASDGAGDNGTYTRFLLDYIDLPGVAAEDIFKMVRGSVVAETQGKQVPWEHSSITKPIYFNNPAERLIKLAQQHLKNNQMGLAYKYAKQARQMARSPSDLKNSEQILDSVRKGLGHE